MGGIVEIQLALLAKRLAERSIVVEMTKAAKVRVATEGYDPRYGARPLKRVMQADVQNPLARLVLNGGIKEGDTVIIDAVTSGANPGGAFAFKVKNRA